MGEKFSPQVLTGSEQGTNCLKKNLTIIKMFTSHKRGKRSTHFQSKSTKQGRVRSLALTSLPSILAPIRSSRKKVMAYPSILRYMKTCIYSYSPLFKHGTDIVLSPPLSFHFTIHPGHHSLAIYRDTKLLTLSYSLWIQVP